MRVLFCQPSSAKKAISGPEWQTVQIAHALQQRGHDVTVAALLLAPAPEGEVTLLSYATSRGIPTAVFFAPSRYYIPDAAKRFREFVSRMKPDVVCVAGYKLDIIAAFCRSIASVAVTRGWTAQDWKVRFFEWLDRKTLKRHAAVITVSPQQYEAVQKLGVSSDRLYYIPNAVDVQSLPGAFSKSALYQHFDLENSYSVLGTVGRLSLEKGHRFALEAAKLLWEEGTTHHWLMVGSGAEEDHLKRIAKSLGLEERVRFLGEREDARRIIGALDLLVLPSLTEGLPNVILEAIAYKTPVVATAVGGVPELVINGETGWLVPPRDPRALAEAIREALSNPEEARRRAENAYRHLLANFTVEKLAESWERALQAVVENWRKRTG